MHIAQLLRRLDNAIMPRCCALCGVRCTADESSLCGGCRQDLPISASPCQPHAPLTTTVAPLEYSFPVDAAIKALKFGRKLYYVPMFAELLADAYSHLPPGIDALLPVPLHWWRHVTRGFNQSVEMCRPLQRASGLPMLRCVVRCRATAFQSGLRATERHKNLRGAFRLQGPLRYRHIVIVDDVITTGETASELARLLLANGARTVSALALARASGIEGVVQRDADKHNQPDQVVAAKGRETAGRLAVTSQPLVPGHQASRSSD